VGLPHPQAHEPKFSQGDKENARLIVAQIVVRALERLKMSHPETSEKRRREQLSFRKALAR
jgi:hypothetical protein